MIRSFQNTQNSPLVETKYGTLRGFVLDNIYTFHGIPYAYADRFQAPQPPEAWEGVRNATNYGYICPSAGSPAPSSELFIPHRFWPADEHCQYLNVWTPGLDDRKRPVMVWFHGGGLEGGSKGLREEFRNQGFAVVDVNYRLYPKVKCPGYLEDAALAVSWVFNNIAQYTTGSSITGFPASEFNANATYSTTAATVLFMILWIYTANLRKFRQICPG